MIIIMSHLSNVMFSRSVEIIITVTIITITTVKCTILCSSKVSSWFHFSLVICKKFNEMVKQCGTLIRHQRMNRL